MGTIEAKDCKSIIPYVFQLVSNTADVLKAAEDMTQYLNCLCDPGRKDSFSDLWGKFNDAVSDNEKALEQVKDTILQMEYKAYCLMKED